ncbi:hypothetical protein DEU34_2519 [Microbacterium sp. AG1240]|uniref:hypothetical protein n=1 Tax=Microbacterium sp. AG1240 TaxID=2183992 RepID=UPI000F2898A5|nr:hypothetical protein [Microbacterium sp. AG1240]RKT31449.1 hypothetical protein DEU34_2519 [Microbacterium sp. AG1240]
MTSNRQTGQAFRAEALIYLLQNGLIAFDPSDQSSAFHSMRTDADQWTHIAGVHPWVVHVRGGATGDVLSEALSDVDTAARAAGTEWGAAILRRRGHETEDSYALMPLRTFARILRGEAPEPPRPPRPVAGIAG